MFNTDYMIDLITQNVLLQIKNTINELIVKEIQVINTILTETQPTTQPTTEPTTQPTTEPIAEPTTEPTTQPTTEPIAEPIAEPTTEPIAEPTTEPTTEPIAEPIAEPTTEPTTEPIAEPINGKGNHRKHKTNPAYIGLDDKQKRIMVTKNYYNNKGKYSYLKNKYIRKFSIDKSYFDDCNSIDDIYNKTYNYLKNQGMNDTLIDTLLKIQK
jgi:hypothetical protein